ncbi:DUF485 domain-containing protein [Propioniciclava tarda]|uniref:DUF485 domain-containing protein n=1 Tax=Propioniciclava tarda TaxID=433330 RepID=A0A4Q9KM85_PROTD|nr:DUF485 domain-containing protein [Propioniciclava tarda]TBT95642.1 DUF485 domain-containing protein [Propioniciclava tarda]SMO46905.1 Uncharacterized membrane protein, DUF485 family [Propioniciclava tarda]HOA87959.1 DUF485 domain-containing protein [Propioniciclava tarda]HQA29893.1 DUF485 domain-containing protein [Propioniciclava tarda]HQD60727.1 DUF485 domain-containing protein [Propioniciclava tarda]
MQDQRTDEAHASQPYHPGGGYAEDGTEFHLPADHWPLPALVHLDAPHAEPSTSQFVAVHGSPEFAKLRSTFRNFAFPMTIAALVVYFTYVVLSIYAVGFMKQPFFGMKGLTVGFAFGLVQYVVVWLWTWLYVRFANTKLDKASSALRTKLEKGAAA